MQQAKKCPCLAVHLSKLGHFAGGLAMMLLVTAVGYLWQEKLELVNIALLYLLPVILAAVWWGRWPSYFTAVSSMLFFNFFFVPPVFKLSVYDIRHIWSFGIFLVVSFLIGGRTELLRTEARMARQREKSVRSLYQFSREIAGVIDLDKIYSELSNQIAESIGREVLVLCPDNQGRLQECGRPAGKEHVSKALSVSEYGVASRSFESGQVVGRTTETLSEAENLYIPFKAGAVVIGVLGIDIGSKVLSPEERRLIEAWGSLAAMAVERVNLVREAQKAALLVESERLRTAIFNSISHELRTPLAAIIGAASSLSDRVMNLSEQARFELLETILDGSSRMERIVINLLDTARQETGRLSLKVDWCEIEDLVGTALQQIQKIKRSHPIITYLPEGLCLFRGDFVLLEQVLVNLLDNAMKYSSPGAPVTIRAAQEGDNLVVSVIDEGSGLAKEDELRIFEKFYRASRKNKVAGIGLGLSICKGIIEAHKGRIWAENQPQGGAKISFCIPLDNEVTEFAVEEGDNNE
jgi:two-component system sensor histidine kinase KdpD